MFIRALFAWMPLQCNILATPYLTYGMVPLAMLDFFVDSGVCAASTADQVVADKQLTGLTVAYVCYEALTIMKLGAFVA